MPSRAELAQMIDHTLLTADATPGDVQRHCAEAGELGVYAVCISPSFLPLPDDWLASTIAVATVCGFPSGKHRPKVKAVEAARSVADGATEVDMVIDIGNAKAGLWDLVQEDVSAVREATNGVLLKVILETAALTDDEIVRCCQICEAAGADFVKTSTGFHAAGGATEHAVALMRQTVGDRLGVKASGGIRTFQAAVAMVASGASRLGLSGTAAVLAGAEAPTDH